MKPITTDNLKQWWPWLGAGLFLAILALLWIPLSQIGHDATVLRRWIEPLGVLGPVAYFILNIIQIVVAPIPGYPVQVLGGVLFGPVIGSITAVGGMTVGGMMAAWLGRRLGRTWLENQIGAEELAKWGQAARIDSFWTWWFILLIPLGDIPYFFAGLSKIRLRLFGLAILTSRGPFSVLIVWFGDRVTTLPLNWLALLMAVIGLVVLLGLSQRARLENWGRAYINRQAEPPPEEAKTN